MGIASGAAMGAGFGGPIGAAIGGGAGGLLSGLSMLLQNSEEAKQKKKLREDLMAQQRDQMYSQAFDLVGGNNSPTMRAAMWDPTSSADVDKQVNAQFREQEPDWAAFLQSIAGSAASVRNSSRADALEELRAKQAAHNGLMTGGNNGLGYLPF